MAKDKRGGKRGGNAGGSSANDVFGGMTPLEAFKENARQLNEAKIAAKKAKASVLKYKGITGDTVTYYWEGRWADRPNPMQETYGDTSGTFTAEFKMPKKKRKE